MQEDRAGNRLAMVQWATTCRKRALTRRHWTLRGALHHLLQLVAPAKTARSVSAVRVLVPAGTERGGPRWTEGSGSPACSGEPCGASCVRCPTTSRAELAKLRRSRGSTQQQAKAAAASAMLPRHLPAVLSCLIAALLVQWAIRRWPQRSAGKPAATAVLVATLDERLAIQDWDGAYAAWGSVLKEAHAPGVPGSIRRARIEVAHKVARARIDRMDADFRAGFPLSSTPPYSSPTFEVVVGALRGAAIFARVDEAEALLLRALKERPFAEIAESVCQGHSNSKKSLLLKAA